MREQITRKILDTKVIAIVRDVYGEDCLKLARALSEGGIRLMEVTFDQSRPKELTRTSNTVRQIADAMGEEMIVGAGTVTSVEMLELACQAGAQFIVSPDVNEEVIRRTRELGLVSLPGAMTPTEILTAHKAGADFVKVFPTSSLGTAYLRAVRAPINHIRLLAVGGVSEKNIAEFIAAGASGAGVGGNLVNKAWIKAGEFEKITALAREYLTNANGG